MINILLWKGDSVDDSDGEGDGVVMVMEMVMVMDDYAAVAAAIIINNNNKKMRNKMYCNYWDFWIVGAIIRTPWEVSRAKLEIVCNKMAKNLP